MRRAGLAAALLLTACAPQTAALPKAPVVADGSIRVEAKPVPEFPPDAPRPAGDDFAFVGGLELTSPDTSRFHGLSDLEVLPDGRFIAVSDEGDLVRGRLVFDARGAPAGMADVTLKPLTNLEGRPLSGSKTDSDSEGLALWPNGDLMISFERNHRIWLYPAKGGPPRAIPSPDAPFPDNSGMEALALDPSAGRDAYITGREDTRETWVCRLSGGCIPGPRAAPDAGAGSLVAARPLPGGRWAYLLRDFSPMTGAVIQIVVADGNGRAIDTHVIKRPANVDNFEGIAALPRPDGTVRFHLIVDDNFSSAERTLFFTFDWTPPKGE